MKIYTCRCGELDGDMHCCWSGALEELVVVEYMPLAIRSAHIAAGNSGAWPNNGAVRAAVHRSCAHSLVADGWCEIVGARVDRYAERVKE